MIKSVRVLPERGASRMERNSQREMDPVGATVSCFWGPTGSPSSVGWKWAGAALLATAGFFLQGNQVLLLRRLAEWGGPPTFWRVISFT